MNFEKSTNGELYELMGSSCTGHCSNADISKGVYSSALTNGGSCATASTCNNASPA